MICICFGLIQLFIYLFFSNSLKQKYAWGTVYVLVCCGNVILLRLQLTPTESMLQSEVVVTQASSYPQNSAASSVLTELTNSTAKSSVDNALSYNTSDSNLYQSQSASAYQKPSAAVSYPTSASTYNPSSYSTSQVWVAIRELLN